MKMIKVKNMENRQGKPVVNQFIITEVSDYLKRNIFQSYN